MCRKVILKKYRQEKLVPWTPITDQHNVVPISDNFLRNRSNDEVVGGCGAAARRCPGSA